MFSPTLQQQFNALFDRPSETFDDEIILLQFCGTGDVGKENADQAVAKMNTYLTFDPNRHSIMVDIQHKEGNPGYYARLIFNTVNHKNRFVLFTQNGDLENILNNHMTVETNTTLSNVQTDEELT